MQSLQRARLSLEGLSLGDALGGFFEMSSPTRLSHFVIQRKLPNPIWRYTDDTNMALSVYEILRRYGQIEQDALATSFVTHYDRSRGYGAGVRAFVARVSAGTPWQDFNGQMFGNGSFGNGGAMRVAPVGAYCADDLSQVVTEAQRSAEITHAHPEGIAGAMVVAVATAIAWQKRTERLSRSAFIDHILPHIPDSDVKTLCTVARDLPQLPILDVVEKIGNGRLVTAQNTIPFVLYSAGENLYDFEQAFWKTAEGGGDVDTTCAMVGGIVAMSVGYEGLPVDWLKYREPLPTWALLSE